ncbi:hypothetical protein TNCV_5117811 [Trichonephila clavipes]|nr:hypothetical protein TNCV_5117811 [Trichonephila clavipes]
MDVCKCIVIVLHGGGGGTLKDSSSRKSSREVDERGKRDGRPLTNTHGVLLQTSDGTVANCTINSMVFEAAAHRRRKTSPLVTMNFMGLDPTIQSNRWLQKQLETYWITIIRFPFYHCSFIDCLLTSHFEEAVRGHWRPTVILNLIQVRERALNWHPTLQSSTAREHFDPDLV